MDHLRYTCSFRVHNRSDREWIRFSRHPITPIIISLISPHFSGNSASPLRVPFLSPLFPTTTCFIRVSLVTYLSRSGTLSRDTVDEGRIGNSEVAILQFRIETSHGHIAVRRPGRRSLRVKRRGSITSGAVPPFLGFVAVWIVELVIRPGAMGDSSRVISHYAIPLNFHQLCFYPFVSFPA